MRTPYESKIIRIRENNKTEWNILDTVKGCSYGCKDCYARSSVDVNTRGINFEIPVPQKFVPKYLLADLEKIRMTNNRNWVRNGVSGDPAFDWELAIEVAKFIHQQGFIMVIMTKMPVLPTAGQLLRLSGYGAVIHLGLVVGQSLSTDPEWKRKVELMRMYQKWAGYDYAILRVGTFAFDESNTDGAALAAEQRAWINMGFKFMEGPWRIKRTHTWNEMGLLDWSQYKQHIAYGSKKNGRKTKSSNFSPKPQVFKGQSNPNVLGCVTDCDVCPNQCGTANL